MCVLCDGGSEEDLLASEFMRIAVNGFAAIIVESDSPWAYTIGLVQSYDHPELVITGLPEDPVGHVMALMVERVRQGEHFTSSSPPTRLCNCTTVAFAAVHPAQWHHGRFDQWLKYYGWVGGDPPERDALQVLWDKDGRFPTDPDFCPVHGASCQPLLDDAPRHNVNTGSSRAQRRRAKYGHGKRGGR